VAAETEPQLGKNLADQTPASSATTAGVPREPVALNSWFAELKRRRVVRTLVGYGIASFAVLQIIEPVMHGLHWPETVLSYVVVALAAGFPVTITLAWIFDVKAGRIERSAPAAIGPRGIRLALLLVGIGALSAAPGLFYYFVMRGGGRSRSTEVSNSATGVALEDFRQWLVRDASESESRGAEEESDDVRARQCRLSYSALACCRTGTGGQVSKFSRIDDGTGEDV
jgi:hypothetical protein